MRKVIIGLVLVFILIIVSLFFFIGNRSMQPLKPVKVALECPGGGVVGRLSECPNQKETILKQLEGTDLIKIWSHTIEREKEETIVFGIKNNLSKELNYKINVEVIKKEQELEINEEDLIFEYDSEIKTLGVGEAYAGEFNVISKGDKVSYIVKLEIINSDDGTIYQEKKFFISVI